MGPSPGSAHCHRPRAPPGSPQDPRKDTPGHCSPGSRDSCPDRPVTRFQAQVPTWAHGCSVLCTPVLGPWSRNPRASQWLRSPKDWCPWAGRVMQRAVPLHPDRGESYPRRAYPAAPQKRTQCHGLQAPKSGASLTPRKPALGPAITISRAPSGSLRNGRDRAATTGRQCRPRMESTRGRGLARPPRGRQV